jgi:hypothetical protein
MSEESRPRVTGYFVEPDEYGAPLLLAIGRAVWGVAALEKTLQLELALILCERAAASSDAQSDSFAKRLSRVEDLTAGQARHELRLLGLPTDLDERIDGAAKRRNQLVHHIVEDPQLVRAIATGEGMDAEVKRVERLALDCGELAVELHDFAVAKLEGILEDPRERAQVEAAQAAADLDWPISPPDYPEA